MHIPLCVDLDGTLIKTDSLLESILLLLKRNPLNFLFLIIWLLKGKAYFKAKIAESIALNPTLLPYSQEFLSYLKAEHAKGRPLWLVTAANIRIAKSIAEHLGIFTDIIASDHQVNLKGKHKKDILNQRFGKKLYDYAGNAHVDVPVWQDARKAIIVNAPANLIKKSHRYTEVESVFVEKKNKLKIFLKAIRVHQFAKNLLIFIPLLVGGQYTFGSLTNAILAFMSFCTLASSIYVLNDLLDLEVDRQHRTKHRRPFAAGDLSLTFGAGLIITLLILTGIVATFLPWQFNVVLLSYLAITLMYSWYLKQVMLVDVFVLAVLYTLRIVGGMVVINSVYSPWLISFSMFLFLSLAFVKRYSELHNAKLEEKSTALGRGYITTDLSQLSLFGTTSGYLSIVVFALYINSDKVIMSYHYPKLLWLVCLILLYWISRTWMLTVRGEMHEDPVVFALKDKTSLLIVIIVMAVIMLALF